VLMTRHVRSVLLCCFFLQNTQRQGRSHTGLRAQIHFSNLIRSSQSNIIHTYTCFLKNYLNVDIHIFLTVFQEAAFKKPSPPDHVFTLQVLSTHTGSKWDRLFNIYGCVDEACLARVVHFVHCLIEAHFN
jgi:hypothetical protein